MAFTRFHDDPARIQKQLAESTFLGRYQLDTPGQGVDLPFMEDPQIRLQMWGANKRYNFVNTESDLYGYTRPVNRDYTTVNSHSKNAVQAVNVNYRNSDPFTEESRASQPAWTYRDLEQTRWEYPLLNPQANLEKKFHDNIQTRILEKDSFTQTPPNHTFPRNVTNLEYYSNATKNSNNIKYSTV